MRKGKEILAFVLALILFLVLTWEIAWALMPVRKEYGCMWDAYRCEEKNSIDLMVVGTSLAYCDVIPAYVWEDSGLRTYVVAGPEQTPPISYYYIREACRTQSPRYLMLELTEMFIPEYGRYTLANISYMPFSVNRIGASFAGAAKEDRFGLLFPLYTYHSRWETAEGKNIRTQLHPEADPLAGYTFLTASKEITEENIHDFTAESEAYRRNLIYLEKIAKFCESEGIELIPYITPSTNKIPADALETLKNDAAALGLTLTDFNEIIPELGLDYATDWYDASHLNVCGAEKFTRWLTGYLTEECGLVPQEAGDTALWTERLSYVNGKLAELEPGT